MSTTPNNTNGEHCFTITHPFHPLCGHSFPLLSQSRAWGEERVFFADPQTYQIRSLPLAWTSLAPPDPFLVVAAGKTVLRFEDIGPLNQMLNVLPAPSVGFVGVMERVEQNSAIFLFNPWPLLFKRPARDRANSTA
ncbi:DUF5372 family protein [Ktedonobacter sp. SOSP1-85]|uniref:DUF5372 family protein n=1 Tax=Ktedonobacter sp. SOSP1-85 TaxID=2778367 RepID=UPI00191689A0